MASFLAEISSSEVDPLIWFENNRQKLHILVMRLKAKTGQENSMKLGKILEDLLVLPPQQLRSVEARIVKIKAKLLELKSSTSSASKIDSILPTSSSNSSIVEDNGVIKTPSKRLAVTLLEFVESFNSMMRLRSFDKAMLQDMISKGLDAIHTERGASEGLHLSLSATYHLKAIENAMQNILDMLPSCNEKWRLDDQILTCNIVMKAYLKQASFRATSSDSSTNSLPSLVSADQRIRANITLPEGILNIEQCDGVADIIS